jgi:hypothetical protein
MLYYSAKVATTPPWSTVAGNRLTSPFLPVLKWRYLSSYKASALFVTLAAGACSDAVSSPLGCF